MIPRFLVYKIMQDLYDPQYPCQVAEPCATVHTSASPKDMEIWISYKDVSGGHNMISDSYVRP